LIFLIIKEKAFFELIDFERSFVNSHNDIND